MVRSSHNIIQDMRKDQNRGYFKAIGKSEWYDYVEDLLDFSKEISNNLETGNENILLHCSDGWDRNA